MNLIYIDCFIWWTENRIIMCVVHVFDFGYMRFYVKWGLQSHCLLCGLINHIVGIGLFHDVLHWKSLACICLSLQYVGRRVYVNLMRRWCSGVTVDLIVHKIHNVYILLVKIWHCVVNSLGINKIVNLLVASVCSGEFGITARSMGWPTIEWTQGSLQYAVTCRCLL